MAIQAILFDLFFTLIDPLSVDLEDEYGVLGMERADFEERNKKDYEIRGRGAIKDPVLMMAHILRGLEVPEELLRRAAEARVERIRQALWGVDPKNTALLTRLRQGGIKTALVSNADCADVRHWPASPLNGCFDAVVFSYDTGLLKPEPAIYRLAAERLGVKPYRCLFVGDGGHDELRGAKEAGLLTALTTEYTAEHAGKATADYTLAALQEVLEIKAVRQTLRARLRKRKAPRGTRSYPEADETGGERACGEMSFDPAAPIETLRLSVRSFNALSRAGITTIGMMLDADRETLQGIKNLGVKSIGEITGWQERLKYPKEAARAPGQAEKRERIRRLHDAFRCVPPSRLEKPLERYLAAVSGAEVRAAIGAFEPLLKPLDTVSQVPAVFETAAATAKSTEDFLRILHILALDLKSIVRGLLTRLHSHPKYERLLSILRDRYDGLTLQHVADKYGLTRERIRQLKTKGTELLVKHLYAVPVDILLFINAETDGDYLFTAREVRDYFGGLERMDTLLYAARLGCVSPFFSYNERLTLFYHTGYIQNIDLAPDAVRDLPAIIEKEKKDAVLSGPCRNLGIPRKAAEIEFSYAYLLSGRVYRRKKLVTTQMYDYVLSKHYPVGLRLYEEDTIRRFRRVVIDTFGAVDLPRNDRAIDARLADIAVLCNRGVYIHPDHITLEEKLLEEICAYIDTSPRVIFSFSELFKTFKPALLKRSNISNKYFLQGVLKYRLKDRFFITRYTLAKKGNASLLEDIEAFVRAREQAHKSEIFAEYAGITEIILLLKMNTNTNLINLGKGWYMHAEKLRIEKRDYRIRKLLKERTQHIPLSARKLFDEMRLSFPDFLSRNRIENHEKLFGILKYMFHETFLFSRPYIARPGIGRLSSVAVIKRHLRPYAAIKIPDMVALCHVHRLYFFSIRILIKELDDEFLRIDARTLARVSAPLSEGDVARIAENLREEIRPRGYRVAAKAEDYRNYPDIGFDWNPFLLRSVAEKYLCDTVGVVDIYTTDTYAMNSIFVDSFLEITCYDDLVRRVLKARQVAAP
ncbi:MAG: HAD-IA family hydrolase, partial [Spirochaetaceae bacterium]|nr:HAD-IA family hydrolase [Spirochaetaceae bacterium]